MYFESRSHQSLPAANAAEAVGLIHHHKAAPAFHVPVFRNAQGQRIGLVDDGHIDHGWQEVAVVNLDTGEQLESITFGWIQSEAMKTAAVEAAVTQATVWRKVKVILDGEHLDKRARFECGCCAESFTSTVQEQKKFDQDAGYGICPRCAHHYA